MAAAIMGVLIVALVLGAVYLAGSFLIDIGQSTGHLTNGDPNMR